MQDAVIFGLAQAPHLPSARASIPKGEHWLPGLLALALLALLWLLILGSRALGQRWQSRPVGQSSLGRSPRVGLRLRRYWRGTAPGIRQRQRQLSADNQALRQALAHRTAVISSTEAQLRTVLATMPVMLNAFDETGNLLVWNQECERVTGYGPADILGQENALAKLYPDTDYRQDMIAQWRSRGNHFRNWEWQLTCKNGQVKTIAWSNLSDQCPVPGWSTWAIGIDISEQKQAEQALREAKEAAELANQSKSRFLASMSHELRTPLNSILGFGQLMLQATPLGAEQREYLEIIRRSGEHLLGLINDVLEISKIEANQVRLSSSPFELRSLFRRLEESLALQASLKGLRFSIILASDVPTYIETDEGKLYQILLNLLGNAVKFTDEGSVILRCRPLAKPAPDPQGQMLRFEVIDSGPGIAPGDIKAIFHPFTQTCQEAQASQGSGLGLFISQRFAELMGGQIKVRSQPNQGSTFRLDLPVQLAEASQIQPSQPVQRRIHSLVTPPSPPRILIAEDRPTNRLLLWKILAPLGFELWQAEQGQEAVALWQAKRPDLILMDMRMPVMDGYEAIARIRELAAAPEFDGPLPKFIALTASAFEADRRKVTELGCDGFVRKPFERDRLLETIGRLLGLRYRYEAPSPAPPPPPPNLPQDLPLPNLPQAWWQALHQAAALGSDHQILQLIQSLPEHRQGFARCLRDWVENYYFEPVLRLAARQLSQPQSPAARKTQPPSSTHRSNRGF